MHLLSVRRARAIPALAVLALLAPAPAAEAQRRSGSTSLAPAPAAQAQRVSGSTSLALDPGAVEALADLGAQVAPLRPSRAAGGALRFAITSFRLSRVTNQGSLGHSGGIVISQGSNAVGLRRFVIRLRRASDLTAVVNGTRIPFLELDLDDATVRARGRRVTISGVRALLTDDAADALNAAFDTEDFEEGLLLGTATIRAQGARERSPRSARVSLTG
jgi:hypothetical protein